MSTRMTFPTEPIGALRELVLRHQPPGHARMTDPGFHAKYLRVAAPLTDADLAAHLAGDITLAAVVQHDDCAYVAACDIDAGGEAMIRRVMRVAETRACHAYGFVLDSGDHQGGHVWIFFEQAYAARDLQTLMRDIVTDAGCPTTEIYPNGADLRLPFGLHRRCQRRGTLLLTSAAAPLDLDADLAGALATFLAEVRLTSDLPVRVAQEAQHARRQAIADAIAAARPRRIDPDAHWREVIAHFNQSTDLVSLLEGYGARAAYHYAGGKTLLHCAAAQDHAHGDTHPSLVVEPGRGQQAGRMICGCYCPACRLHNRPGQVMDAFEVYCRMEGIAKRDAVQRLQGSAPLQTAPRSVVTPVPIRAALSCPVPSQPLPSVDHVAQRRLVELQSDRRAQPLDRRLLAYVISHGAQGQGLANATLAAALGARPDSIKRAKRRLRELGYINVAISSDGVSASAITILAPDASVSYPPPVVVHEDAVHNGSETVSVLLERDMTVLTGGGVQTAPPFHVSESTCDALTPPPESERAPDVAPEPQVRSEAQLRRRRGVLLEMLRAGMPERRRRAFTTELASLEAHLALDQPPTADSPSSDADQGASDVPMIDDQPSIIDCQVQLAHPDDPHPALTDAQLTALLRDALHDCLLPALRPILDRVSWRLEGKNVVLVCAVTDLAPVTGQLLAPARRMMADLALAGIDMAMTVQIGRPLPAEVKPMWLDDTVWMQVPIWARSLLVGSTLVDGQLYGATPAHTQALGAQGDTMMWLLDQASHVAIGDTVRRSSRA